MLGSHEVLQHSRVPFEAAAALKERLNRNDIWALTTDGNVAPFGRTKQGSSFYIVVPPAQK